MPRFIDITVRTTGTVDPSWWNTLRSAGVALESVIGKGYVGETSFAFANNQVAAADITGCALDVNTYVNALIWISLKRKTDTQKLYSWIEVYVRYNDVDGSWDILDTIEHGPTASGLTFSTTLVGVTGQLKYTSDNLTGANYTGASRFKIFTFEA